MKRLATLILALVLVLLMAPGVRADIIYVPSDNFLERHMDDCTHVDRAFETLTEVTVYHSPEDATVMGKIPQGTSVPVYYVYTDKQGNEWGLVELYEENISGWVAMAYLDLIYDFISFEEDYGHAFREEEWALPAEYAAGVIRFWAYPGSDRCTEFDLAAWGGDWMPTAYTLYTDPEGRNWAYINYYYGIRSVWLCVDDPTADFETLYPNGAPEVEITQPGETEPTLPDQEIKPGGMPTGIIGIAVAACAGATAAVLVMKKKKQA